MAKDRVKLTHPSLPPEVDRYLVPTEQVVFMVHRHWASQSATSSKIGAILVVLLGLQIALGGALPWVLVLVVLAGALGWGGYTWLDHHREVFIATDRRLMVVHGIWTRKVDMMPLGKLTDMKYTRTPVGKALGYGTFVIESAGQDQALSKITYVPKPDTLYRTINGVLFGPSSRRIGDRPPPMGSALPLQEPNDMWWKKR